MGKFDAGTSSLPESQGGKGASNSPMRTLESRAAAAPSVLSLASPRLGDSRPGAGAGKVTFKTYRYEHHHAASRVLQTCPPLPGPPFPLHSDTERWLTRGLAHSPASSLGGSALSAHDDSCSFQRWP